MIMLFHEVFDDAIINIMVYDNTKSPDTLFYPVVHFTNTDAYVTIVMPQHFYNSQYMCLCNQTMLTETSWALPPQ